MVDVTPSQISELSTAVGVLSAMITPAILILASGSILGTTSARLIRAHDRLRSVAADIQTLVSSGKDDELTRQRLDTLFVQLDIGSRRARILQRAMTFLYLAVAAFVMTSIVIGILSLTKYNVGWISLIVGFIGAMLLLAASVMLIMESRLAVYSTRLETEFVRRWGAHIRGSFPPGS